MALVDKVVRIEAKGNDLERRLLMPARSRCFLLKRGKETSQFEVVAELKSGWKVLYSNFNQQMTLYHADAVGDFSDLLGVASWIGYGVPDAVDQLNVYKMDPARQDVVPPTANEGSWQIYLNRDPKERFTVSQ